MRRQVGYMIAAVVLLGAGDVLIGGASLHDAIRYGIGALTGAFIGFGLARR